MAILMERIWCYGQDSLRKLGAFFILAIGTQQDHTTASRYVNFLESINS